ncbi:putative lipoprotein [Exiguobacterium sp. S17]|nr:putative lipoprotein [Exiguobacterium sp. S17]
MKRKGTLAASLLATGIILGACGGADEEPMNNDDTEMQEDDMDEDTEEED